MAAEEETLELTDPLQLRAIAHPLRLRLLGLLRTDGPATATTLAERVDESPALVSYHLRTLAAHGFVVEAPDLATDGRQRWWRAAQASMSWSQAEFLDTPERSAAASALMAEIADRYGEVARGWVAETQDWSPDWVDAAEMSDFRLELSALQVRALRGELREVIERYRTTPPDDGAERVRAILMLLPHRPGGA
jgi:DNA-binding transcriptional ArsR family regulator